MTVETRLGRCLNINRCSIADDGTRTRLDIDAPFVCPECGRNLVEVVTFGKKKPATKVEGPVLPPKRLLLMAAFVVTMIVFGVAFGLFGPLRDKASDSIGADADGVTAQTLFRVGSTPDMQAVLTPALVAGFLRQQGCTTVSPVTDVAGNARLRCEANGSRIAVTMFQTADPMGPLGRKTVDVALTSRKITADQAGALLARGDMTAVNNEQLIARDAIAVVTHPSNPVARLSQAQLTAILTGATSDFANVGGKPGPIRLTTPAAGSRIDDMVQALVLGNDAMAAGTMAAGTNRVAGTVQVVAAVAADPGAIGIVDINGLSGGRALAIGPSKGIALKPTPMALASGDYGLMRSLFLYKPEIDQRPDAAAFADFVASAEGERIIASIGLVPLKIIRSSMPAIAGAPAEYSALTSGAERVSATIRFRPGTITIDNRGQSDLQTVAAHLLGERVAGRQVMVLGFTDPPQGGTAETSVDISAQNLARQVAATLGQHGLMPGTVRGFGAALPIADNATPAGRNHNRRVEIWVAP